MPKCDFNKLFGISVFLYICWIFSENTSGGLLLNPQFRKLYYLHEVALKHALSGQEYIYLPQIMGFKNLTKGKKLSFTKIKDVRKSLVFCSTNNFI